MLCWQIFNHQVEGGLLQARRIHQLARGREIRDTIIAARLSVRGFDLPARVLASRPGWRLRRNDGWKGRHIEKIAEGEGQKLSLNPQLSVVSLALFLLASSTFFHSLASLPFLSFLLLFLPALLLLSGRTRQHSSLGRRFHWLHQEPTTPRRCCISIIEFLAQSFVAHGRLWSRASEGDMFCVRFIRERSHEESCACHRSSELQGRKLAVTRFYFPIPSPSFVPPLPPPSSPSFLFPFYFIFVDSNSRARPSFPSFCSHRSFVSFFFFLFLFFSLLFFPATPPRQSETVISEPMPPCHFRFADFYLIGFNAGDNARAMCVFSLQPKRELLLVLLCCIRVGEISSRKIRTTTFDEQLPLCSYVPICGTFACGTLFRVKNVFAFLTTLRDFVSLQRKGEGVLLLNSREDRNQGSFLFFPLQGRFFLVTFSSEIENKIVAEF